MDGEEYRARASEFLNSAQNATGSQKAVLADLSWLYLRLAEAADQKQGCRFSTQPCRIGSLSWRPRRSAHALLPSPVHRSLQPQRLYSPRLSIGRLQSWRRERSRPRG